MYEILQKSSLPSLSQLTPLMTFELRKYVYNWFSNEKYLEHYMRNVRKQIFRTL